MLKCLPTSWISCEGTWCDNFILSVETTSLVPTSFQPASGCIHGDTVKLQSNDGYDIYMHEFAVVVRLSGSYILGFTLMSLTIT